MNLINKNKKVKESKELKKAFTNLMNDIMDNYDKYNERQKTKIKNLYENALNLNKELESYDDKKNLFQILQEAFCNFFGIDK